MLDIGLADTSCPGVHRNITDFPQVLGLLTIGLLAINAPEVACAQTSCANSIAGLFAGANDGDAFNLVQMDYTASYPDMFEAGAQTPDGFYDNTSVNWTVGLQYTTSGGVGPFFAFNPGNPSTDPANHQQTFTTTSAMDMQQCNSSVCYTLTYESEGGVLTAMASATVTNPPNQTPLTCPVSLSFTTSVLGPKSIPMSEIVSYEVSQYASVFQAAENYAPTTPTLIAGVSKHESQFYQFKANRINGIKGQWPLESPYTPPPHETPTGKRCGLTQVLTNMNTAFDWHQNVMAGVLLYVTYAFATMLKYESMYVTAYPGLPAMNGVQREDVALGYYFGITKAPSAQVWVPSCSGTVSGSICNGGTWQWIFNPNMPSGYRGFVTYVRNYTGGPL